MSGYRFIFAAMYAVHGHAQWMRNAQNLETVKLLKPAVAVWRGAARPKFKDDESMRDAVAMIETFDNFLHKSHEVLSVQNYGAP